MKMTKDKVKVMDAYLEGADIAWTKKSVASCGGTHNIRNETPTSSPVWDWGTTDYDIMRDKINRFRYVNIMKKDGGIGGYYKTQEEAEDCSGEWNSAIAIKVQIKEIN